MNLKEISEKIEQALCSLFDEMRTSISSREDSRAFGAMIEKRITSHWPSICENLGYMPSPIPGRRTLYDFAFNHGQQIVGIDVKTKDLDSSRYSDGGICLFVTLAIQHYQRVSRDALKRIEALQKFKDNGYQHFTFSPR